MTTRLKIEKRRSEIRSRLNEIRELADDKRTDAIKTECSTLERELRDSETELRAAIESEERDLSNDGGGDHERRRRGRASRASRARVSFGDYVAAAAEQRAADGAALEYNQALRHRGQSIPAGDPGPGRAPGRDGRGRPRESESTWVDRLFRGDPGRVPGNYVRVRHAPGVSSHPVTTAGPAGSAKSPDGGGGRPRSGPSPPRS